MPKQTIEERKLHHQTREDRQRKAYEVLQKRIRDGVSTYRGHSFRAYNVEAAERDAANLRRKLNL
jgi:hypothetical protein